MPSLRTAVSTLGWAAYLACSWTWCIGMFLPVLLVRDYGLWGFVVFAVPNVLGAAAMAWVIKTPSSSRRLIVSHRTAMSAFSIVTVLFQIYFAAWLACWVSSMSTSLVFAYLIVFAALRYGWWGWRVSAVIMLLSSFGAVAANLTSGALGFPKHSPPPTDLLFLAPAIVFGFVLCPYLDLTFHRARRATSGTAGQAAFGIGFGLLFLAMILFTLAYGFELPHFRYTMDFGWAPEGLIVTHILVQLAFTAFLHTDEAAKHNRRPRLVVYGLLLAGLAVAYATKSSDLTGPDYHILVPGELVYRLFMSFYGLVFPAYVYLCMIPTRGTGGSRPPTRPPTRRHIRVWAFAVGVAAPMFWLGFIERETVWLVPGLLVVLLARLAIPRAAGRKEPIAQAIDGPPSL